MSLPQHNSSSDGTAAELRSADGVSLKGSASSQTSSASAQEFSPEERALLLRLAHGSIASAFEGREISLEPPTAHLAELRGGFTSLYRSRDGHERELRGCVGYVLPACPVYRMVAETARAAAFDDNRFPPVAKEEAPQLEIELSILSRPLLIQPEAIEVGRHGLLIAWHGRRGLLLPQVSVERGWDRVTFLEQACRKAGLPGDAWQKGASVAAFTAEVFGEKRVF